jgi:sugar phosphate isomerase/epimerase
VAKQWAQGAPAAEKIGWRLGMQAYTFHHYTFFEAVEKTAQLGLKWIEAYPGQILNKKYKDTKFNHAAPPELWDVAAAKLKAEGVRLVNYGVVRLKKDEAACRQVFDFAKVMGIETLVAEPTWQAFPLLDTLCKQYKMNIAIHNHPGPSRWARPEKILKATQGLSKRIGSCADTGHWIRTGVDPLAAVCMLKGRIVSAHLKDLNELAREAHDVPFGTGVGQFREILAELRRQKFQGVFSIEYEHKWKKAMPDIAKCVNAFDEAAKYLA